MTTQHELIASAALAEAAPILREAALQIADPQVRYVGTLGGNVANGDPGNDMPALMLALDATYVLSGPAGERRVAARDFYLGIYETALRPGEILTEIRIAAPPKPHGWAYEKLKRKVGDYATAAAAVVMTVVGRPGRDLRDRADQRRRPAAPGRGRRPAVIGTALDRPEPEAGRRRRRGDRRTGRGRPRFGGISDENGRRHDAPGARARLRPRHILKRDGHARSRNSRSQSRQGQRGDDGQRQGGVGRGRAAHAADPLPARASEPDRLAHRLRHLALRRLHGRRRRPVGQVLHDVRHPGRGRDGR